MKSEPTNRELLRHFRLVLNVLKKELSSLSPPTDSYAEVRRAFIERVLDFACDEVEAAEEQFVKGRLLQTVILARPMFEVGVKLLWSSLCGVSGWKAWQSASISTDAERIIALRGTTTLSGFLKSLCCVLDDQGQCQDSLAKKKADEIQAYKQASQALGQAIKRGKSKFLYCQCGTRVVRPSSNKKVRNLVKYGCPSCGSPFLRGAGHLRHANRMPDMRGLLENTLKLDKKSQKSQNLEEWENFAKGPTALDVYHVQYGLSSEVIHAHLPALRDGGRLNEKGVVQIVGRATAMIARAVCRELGLTWKDIEAKAIQAS